jgi:N-acetylglucosaminyl-diphospho-decaprenol L-rhamnosyltransferase
VKLDCVTAQKDCSWFVIVHWNRPKECLATIRSAKAQIPNLHILVLDNNSSFANYQNLRNELPAVEVLRFQENNGWGPVLNVALQKWLDQENNRYCFISAHDAELGRDCLPNLQAAMDADAKLGIACPRYPNGSVPKLSRWHGVSYRFVDPSAVWRNFSNCEAPAGQVGKLVPPTSGYVEYVDVSHGTLMIVRRECLMEIGLFDVRYFAYGDEHELGARARRHGWKVGLVWNAMVANPQTSTPGGWRSYLFARNSVLLVRDYFGKWAGLLRAVAILTTTVRRALFQQQNHTVFSARAQWRGLLDYFAGRFGAPPPSLMRSSRSRPRDPEAIP